MGVFRLTITLYKVSCAPNTVDKTDFLSDEYALTQCRPNEPCDILSPSIVLSYVNSLETYNYVYIPEFHRYYFITGISLLSGKRAVINCAVDVLHTYHADIKNCNGTIVRAEKPKSRNIHDSKYPIIDKMESTSTLWPPALSPFTAANGWNYVLTVVGGGST